MTHVLTHHNSPLETTRGFSRLRTGSTRRQFSDHDQSVLHAIIHGKYETTHDKSFDSDGTAAYLFSEALEVPTFNIAWYQPAEGIPARATAKKTLLTGPQERTLFLQYNYCRYRVLKLRTQIDPGAIEYGPAREMLDWHLKAERYCEQITHANLALVLAMAKRTRITHVEFGDLVGEGNMALLRAITKFDVSRGFKFSTYACRAILKAYSRIAVRSGRMHKLFTVEFDPAFEETDHLEKKREQLEVESVEKIREIMRDNKAGLSPIETVVIANRFAIGTEPQKARLTLQQVGKMIGVTKERARQIQIRALEKIRLTFDE